MTVDERREVVLQVEIAPPVEIAHEGPGAGGKMERMGALIGRAAGVAAGHDRPRAFMGPGGLRVGGDLRKRLVHVRTLSVAGPLALGALPCRPRPRRSLPGPFRHSLRGRLLRPGSPCEARCGRYGV